MRLKASPAAFVGLVHAADRESAIKTAIKQFEIRPADQRRLLAVKR
jgi:1,2-phenylacetyl-CoA epoxidase PaaB subunit